MSEQSHQAEAFRQGYEADGTLTWGWHCLTCGAEEYTPTMMEATHGARKHMSQGEPTPLERMNQPHQPVCPGYTTADCMHKHRRDGTHLPDPGWCTDPGRRCTIVLAHDEDMTVHDAAGACEPGYHRAIPSGGGCRCGAIRIAKPPYVPPLI